jgi:hypothetical protein
VQAVAAIYGERGPEVKETEHLTKQFMQGEGIGICYIILTAIFSQVTFTLTTTPLELQEALLKYDKANPHTSYIVREIYMIYYT